MSLTPKLLSAAILLGLAAILACDVCGRRPKILRGLAHVSLGAFEFVRPGGACPTTPGRTVNPGFGGQSFITSQLRKIEAVRKMIDKTGRDIRLQVDGGISAPV